MGSRVARAFVGFPDKHYEAACKLGPRFGPSVGKGFGRFALGGSTNSAPCVDEALAHGEICRATRRVAQIPVAATSAVSMFNGTLKVSSLFPGDTIAWRAMDVLPRYSLSRWPSGGVGYLSQFADRHFWSAEVHSDG